jgi:hypothetical protein
MARLGEFGAAQKELSGEQDDFLFFGEPFIVAGAIPPMLMLQLAAAATGKIDESEGMAAIWEALRCSLTTPAHKRPAQDGEEPDENGEVEVPADPTPFNNLYKLAVEKSCDMESMMRLIFALFEAQTGRPTQPVSDSSTGQSNTSPSSNDSATHPALAGMASVHDLVRGQSRPVEVQDPSNTIRMADGTLAVLEQTG